jgi:cyclase
MDEAFVTRHQGERIYVGSAMNIFNQLENQGCRELAIFNIDSSRPSIIQSRLKRIISTTLIPITYGGGVKTLDDANIIFACGVERVVIGNAFLDNPSLITSLVSAYGAQSISVSLDVMINGGSLFVRHRNSSTYVPLEHILPRLESLECSELIVSFIDCNQLGNSLLPLSPLLTLRKAFSNQLIYGGGLDKPETITNLSLIGLDGVLLSSAICLIDSYTSICVDFSRYNCIL